MSIPARVRVQLVTKTTTLHSYMISFHHACGVSSLARRSAVFAIMAFAAMAQGCDREPFIVPACIETDPVASTGDAADDAAIWVNESAPAESIVLGTDKGNGLFTYDLTGRELDFLPLGKINNVDLRSSFRFADHDTAPIIALSNLEDQTVVLMRFDEAKRRVAAEPVGRIHTGFTSVYGVCLYQSKGGSIHVGASSKDGGFRQWRLTTNRNGSISADLVRSIHLSSKAEGCVYDDELGRLYLAEEDVGLWRLPALPEEGDELVSVDKVQSWGGLKSDVEGVAILTGGGLSGYIVASSQGNSTFQVYDREGANAYLGSFRVGGCGEDSPDSVTGTDGIDGTTQELGPNWPGGLLVVQDHENTAPKARQNYKYVRWDEIERQLTR